MSSIQMTEEQLMKLLDAVKTSGGTTTIVGRPGNFSSCTARFDGIRDHNIVEDFINKINIYKSIEGIHDDDAIKGLPLLLSGTAAKWRQGVKGEAKTWQEVITLIKSAFSPA